MRWCSSLSFPLSTFQRNCTFYFFSSGWNILMNSVGITSQSCCWVLLPCTIFVAEMFQAILVSQFKLTFRWHIRCHFETLARRCCIMIQNVLCVNFGYELPNMHYLPYFTLTYVGLLILESWFHQTISFISLFPHWPPSSSHNKPFTIPSLQFRQ